MYAADGGSVESVTLLLNVGANVNDVNKDKKSALMLACEKGHTAVVDLLLKAGADVNRGDKVGSPFFRPQWC